MMLSVIITKNKKGSKHNDATKGFYNELTPLQKLHIVLDIVLPLCDLHYFNSSSTSNAAVIAHNDIKFD